MAQPNKSPDATTQITRFVTRDAPICYDHDAPPIPSWPEVLVIPMSVPTNPRLLILGTGFASFSLVRGIDVRRYDVTVVSPRNHFLFTPLLPSTTVGTVEFRSIIEPIRIARPGIRYYQASCIGVDIQSRTIRCKGEHKDNEFTLEYDLLAIGVGAVSNTFGIPGVREHAFFLKELHDAREIRQRVIACFEQASEPNLPAERVEALLHFIVVGGGPTGVEFAAELHDFVKQDVGRWFPDIEGRVHITLLEAMDEILSSFDAGLSAYTRRHFQRTGVNVRTQARVRQVHADRVELGSSETIPCGLTVWSTGIAATDLVKNGALPLDARSRVAVDGNLCAAGLTDVFAIGDCAAITGNDLPPTAQVAQQQGAYLAKALNRRANGKPAKPFAYRHMGMLAYIGESRALADLKNVKSRGFGTWLFWRSAYLTKLVSFKNKVLVLNDWLRTLVFGRDISRF